MSGGLNPDIVECQYTDTHRHTKKRKHEINYLPLQQGLFFFFSPRCANHAAGCVAVNPGLSMSDSTQQLVPSPMLPSIYHPKYSGAMPHIFLAG